MATPQEIGTQYNSGYIPKNPLTGKPYDTIPNYEIGADGMPVYHGDGITRNINGKSGTIDDQGFVWWKMGVGSPQGDDTGTLGPQTPYQEYLWPSAYGSRGSKELGGAPVSLNTSDFFNASDLMAIGTLAGPVIGGALGAGAAGGMTAADAATLGTMTEGGLGAAGAAGGDLATFGLPAGSIGGKATVNIPGIGEVPVSVLGSLLGHGLGAVGSYVQSNNLSDLASKYGQMGAPYRDQLAAITKDPSLYYNSPGAQGALNGVLQQLSVNGNPFGNSTSLQLASKAAMSGYGAERDRLAGYGGLTSYNQALPQLEAGAVNASGNIWNAVGAGVGDIFNPKPTLMDILNGVKGLNSGVA